MSREISLAGVASSIVVDEAWLKDRCWNWAQLFDALAYCHSQGGSIVTSTAETSSLPIRGGPCSMDFGLVKLWNPSITTDE